MATTEPIRNPREVKKFIRHFRRQGNVRNLVMVTLALHTALRISDLLRLNCDDVYDFARKTVRTQIAVTEKKTGKTKTVALHREIVAALADYFPHAASGAPLILNARTGKAISRVQAYRIIREAASALQLEQRVSCHSLRKTFGYQSWKKGTSPVVIMEIYNHNSFAVTRRYLGVTQDDKNSVYLGLDYAG